MTNYLHMSQADPLWASAKMNVGTFQRSACLVTCLAMKFGGETGRVITPLELDAYLDAHRGYAKGSDVLVWDVAIAFAKTKGLGYTRVEFADYPNATGAPPGDIIKVETSRGTGHFVLSDGEWVFDPGTAIAWRIRQPRLKLDAGYTPKEIRRLV